jgi:hypothetical protein
VLGVAGNTADVNVVEEVKRDLNEWKLGRVMLVMDAGFNSESQPPHPARRRRRLHHRRAAALGSKGDVVEAARRAAATRPSESGLAVKEVTTNQGSVAARRFVIVHNPEQERFDRERRDDIVAETERRLGELGDLTGKAHTKAACALRAHPTYGRYVRQSKTGKLAIDRAKIATEAKLDGKFLVSTSDPHLSTEDIALGYKQLHEIERVNRDLKHTVDIRPVYHRREDRIRAHVLLCWLALLLIRVIENDSRQTWHQLKPHRRGHRPGQNRILLVMATGTGKTYTAFQIIWRLWKSRRQEAHPLPRRPQHPGRPDEDQRLQAVRSGDDQDHQPHGRQVLRDLPLALPGRHRHRGGAEHLQAVLARLLRPHRRRRVPPRQRRRGLAWREVLEYFDSATQIGMTATPKETKDVSNIDYFGEPVYTYSPEAGHRDGFLAPYKVVRIDLDKDLDGWRPEKGRRRQVRRGDRGPRSTTSATSTAHLFLEERTEARRRQGHRVPAGHRPLRQDDRLLREHRPRRAHAPGAGQRQRRPRRRQQRYVMRITGDNDEGKAQLDNFIDPEQPYPVIATTSKLMTTGVDAQTCQLIVLDQRIQSMTEFKQIIGRGTRINEDYGKYFFTIMDFKQGHRAVRRPRLRRRSGADLRARRPRR